MVSDEPIRTKIKKNRLVFGVKATCAKYDADYHPKQRNTRDVIQRRGGNDQRMHPLINSIPSILQFKETGYDNSRRDRCQQQP